MLLLVFFFPLLWPTSASTALRAISRLCSGVSLAARIFPPFDPPSFPRATAFGFFFFTIDGLKLIFQRYEINYKVLDILRRLCINEDVITAPKV